MLASPILSSEIRPIVKKLAYEERARKWRGSSGLRKDARGIFEPVSLAISSAKGLLPGRQAIDPGHAVVEDVAEEREHCAGLYAVAKRELDGLITYSLEGSLADNQFKAL